MTVASSPAARDQAAGLPAHEQRPGEGRFRLRHLVRDVPLLVWLVTALHLLVMVVNVGFWAPNRGPDEPRHVALSAAVASGAAVPWPEPGTFSTTQGASAGLLSPVLAKGKTLYDRSDAPATRADWPSYLDAGGDRAGRLPNQLVQHPPTFYFAMGAALHLLPDWAGRPYLDVYLFLRLLNVLLLAPMPLLLYAGARRLLGAGPAAQASAAFVLVVPQLGRTGASVENDNLMIVLLTALTVLTTYVVTGDTSRRTALGIGVLGALALLTKGLALFLPLYLVVVYAYAWRRSGRAAVPSGLLALAVAGLGSGWWWLRNMAAFGVIQPEGNQIVQNGLGPPRTSFGETGGQFVEGFLRRLNYRFWLDGHVWAPPRWVELFDGVLSLLLLGGLVVGLVTAHRWVGLGRARALVLLVPVCCQLGIVVVGAWHGWESTLRPAGQQGRYLYGGLLGLVVVACAGFAQLLGRRAALLPLLVAGAGLVATLAQFALGFRIYDTPRRHTSYLHDLTEGTRNLLAWSPMPATPFWLACAVTAGLAIAVLAAAALGAGLSGPRGRRSRPSAA